MAHLDMDGFEGRESNQEGALGSVARHELLPGAIRSLDDQELRLLLVALLQEWRGRSCAGVPNSEC
jgi:hypothetical protein